jgi:hypothetical protein
MMLCGHVEYTSVTCRVIKKISEGANLTNLLKQITLWGANVYCICSMYIHNY